MVLAVVGSGAYKLFLYLHILSAIVGFGAVVLNGVYAAEIRKRPGPGGQAIFEANFFVSRIGEYCIYGVFVFGLITSLVGNDYPVKMARAWLAISVVLYFVGIALSHAIMIPSAKKMKRLLVEVNSGPPPSGGPPPQVAEMEALGQRMAITGMVLNLLLVVILFMMVVKPGLGPTGL